jgi:SAM-dependent methyltransferase
MCNRACLAYGEAHLTEADIRGNRVIEVGARNVNGSLRPFVEGFGPASYVGVDIETGPGVDEVCDAEDLVARFGRESFDLVICTEVLEHVRNWRVVMSNLKQLLAANGVLLITTRSYGFPYHAFPYDFWRYEVDDMGVILSDLDVEDSASDPGKPGVFVKARRPERFLENDLAGYELYSMVRRRRSRDVGSFEVTRFTTQWRVRRFAGKRLPPKVKSWVKGARPDSA